MDAVNGKAARFDVTHNHPEGIKDAQGAAVNSPTTVVSETEIPDAEQTFGCVHRRTCEEQIEADFLNRHHR